jgi:hypothetical protein
MHGVPSTGPVSSGASPGMPAAPLSSGASPAVVSGTGPIFERVAPTLPVNHAPVPQLQPDPPHPLTRPPAAPARRGRTVALVVASAAASAVVAVLVMRGCRSESAKPEAPVALAGSGSGEVGSTAPPKEKDPPNVALGSGKADQGSGKEPSTGEIIADVIGGLPGSGSAKGSNKPTTSRVGPGSGSARKPTPTTTKQPDKQPAGSGSAQEPIARVEKPVEKPIEKPVVDERPPEPVKEPIKEPPPAIGAVKIGFDDNNASLSPEGRAQLDRLRPLFVGKPFRLRVIGHARAGEGGQNPEGLASGRINSVVLWLTANISPRLRRDQVVSGGVVLGKHSGVVITTIVDD